MAKTKQKQTEHHTIPNVAVLEHLSGPSIGLETLLYSDRLDITLEPDRLLTVDKTPHRTSAKSAGRLITRLVRTGRGGHIGLKHSMNAPFGSMGGRFIPVNSSTVTSLSSVKKGRCHGFG
jgi:hypothetical protein